MPAEPTDHSIDAALRAWGSDRVPDGFADRVLAAAASPSDPAPRTRSPRPAVDWRQRALIGVLGAVAVASAGIGVHLLRKELAEPANAPPAPVPETSTAPDPPPAPGFLPSDLADRIDTHIGAYGRHYGPVFRFSGVVAVGRPGVPTLVRAYGSAHRGDHRPNTSHTAFRLGVASQPITASAVLLLLDRGKLQLDEPVETHLRGVPAGDEIRIRDLLAHTSGLDNYTERRGFARWVLHPHGTDAVLAYLKRDPDAHEPGQEFHPSNADAYVLSRLVEQVSGRPWAEFVQDEIFAPLEMVGSHVIDTDYREGDAIGYAFDEQEILHPVTRLPDPSNVAGVSDIVATAEDLVRWSNALHGGRLLQPSTVRLMQRPFQAGFGLGFAITEVHGRPVAAHPGGADGFGASIVRYLDDGTTVVVLTNTDVIDARKVSGAICDLLAGEEPEIPAEHLEVESPPVSLARFRGRFELSGTSRRALRDVMTPRELEHMQSIVITEDQGRLFMSYPFWISKWLHPLGEDRFFIKDGSGTLATFGPPGDAPPKWLRLRSPTAEITFLRSTDRDGLADDVGRRKQRQDIEQIMQDLLPATDP